MEVHDIHHGGTEAHQEAARQAEQESVSRQFAEFAAAAQREVDKFNANYPVGTMVRYWRGLKHGQPSGTGPTRSEAKLSCGTPVVLVAGCSGYVALTHIEVAPAGAIFKKGEKKLPEDIGGLTLSREPGESLRVGPVVITLLHWTRNVAKVRVVAPKTMPIDRLSATGEMQNKGSGVRGQWSDTAEDLERVQAWVERATPGQLARLLAMAEEEEGSGVRGQWSDTADLERVTETESQSTEMWRGGVPTLPAGQIDFFDVALRVLPRAGVIKEQVIVREMAYLEGAVGDDDDEPQTGWYWSSGSDPCEDEFTVLEIHEHELLGWMPKRRYPAPAGTSHVRPDERDQAGGVARTGGEPHPSPIFDTLGKIPGGEIRMAEGAL